MKHTKFSLRRPVTISMVFAALAVIGSIASQLLPLEEFPDIQFPGFFVNIPYDGSTPKETERQITRPAEEALATLNGIKNMYSTSNEDSSQIFLEYGFNSNVQTAAVEARVKLDAIRDQMPTDLERIQVFSGSMSDQPIMQLRVSSERDLSTQYELLDRLVKRRLERVEGVSQVQIQGVEPPEISIRLDAGRVDAHNLDLAALGELLRRSNFVVSGGQITSGGERWSLRPNGEFKSIDGIRDMVIDGRNLRLRDVATVTQAPRERNYGRHLDGNYAIGISVSRATDHNMVAVSDRVKAEVRAIGEMPQMQGIRIFDLENQAESVRNSLRDLVMSGLIGAFLAVVVLYIFLRHWTSTLIVTLSVPLSLVITLGAMYFIGLTLNVLTLMGLMLAIGMLVDNAVVVTESIFRFRQMQPDDVEGATLNGVGDVGLAVIASTATSVCVFLPLIFGEQIDVMVFLQHVAITISIAIICSLVIAQTLIPMLTSRMRNIPKPNNEHIIARLAQRYSRMLSWVVTRRGWRRLIAPIIAIVILASPAIPIGAELLRVDVFPEEASRRIFLRYNVNDYYSLERSEQAVDRIEAFLFANKERLDIRSVYSFWERGRAESTILLTQGDKVSIDSKEVMKIILEEKPDIAIGEPSFQRNQQGMGEGFGITLYGESTERLIPLTIESIRLLKTIEGLEDFSTDLTAGQREVQVHLDRQRASSVGLSAQQVAQSISVALRGERLREFRSVDGEIQMRLAFSEDDRQSMEQLGALTIPATDAAGVRRNVTLSSIANLEEMAGPRNIRRANRRTSVGIQAALAGEATMDSVRENVESVMNQMAFPAGYGWSFGRGFDRSDNTQNLLMENILLGVLLIFLVMAALFESLLYPLSIMVSLVYSFVGVVWFLALTGTPLTFMGMTGLMILIGIVVNNGIVLVDHINTLRHEGMPRDEAVVVGAHDRLRPILMTAATTILGLTPLAFGDTQVGSGGPAYYPMARAIIGGLAFSTIVSLFVVPMVYIGLDKLKNWSSGIWRNSKATTNSALPLTSSKNPAS